jgi:hypothetical protein
MINSKEIKALLVKEGGKVVWRETQEVARYVFG